MPRPRPATPQILQTPCTITHLRDHLADYVQAIQEHVLPSAVIARSGRELAALVPPPVAQTPVVRFTNSDGPDDYSPVMIQITGAQAVMTYWASDVGWITLSGVQEGELWVLKGYQNGSRDQHHNGEWIVATFVARDAHNLLRDPEVRELRGTWEGTWTEPAPAGKHGGTFHIPREAFVQSTPSSDRAR